MSLKVLIAPDKFKGTLTAAEAADAIAQGWRRARPNDTLDRLPMSDGGDGFGEVVSRLLRAKLKMVKTMDAAHRPCHAQWWWEPDTRTAIIESANVIGLAKLPAKKFHPFQLDTVGLGAVIQAAVKQGAKHCLMGIGGSATNDGGFGVARALGWEFLDSAGKPIDDWTKLTGLVSLRAPQQRRWFTELIVAVDVRNPLLGANGCTRIYGPQKGLRPRDFPLAERNLRKLAQVAEKFVRHGSRSRQLEKIAGAGAAGGLGFGLACFLGAKLQSGFDLIARKANLAQRLRATDLVITGEGAFDASTLMGKVPGQIAERCQKLKIPCIGLAGKVSVSKKRNYFTQHYALTDLTTAKNARAKAAFWLARLAEKAAREYAVNIQP